MPLYRYCNLKKQVCIDFVTPNFNPVLTKFFHLKNH